MPAKSRRRPVASDRRFRNNAAAIPDYGPRERWQHCGRLLEFTETAGILAARVTEEHIVDVLVMKGLLNKSQSAAAFKLKQDYQRAGMEAHVTSTYSPVRIKTDFFHGDHERNDFEEAAYQRWRNAVRELGLRLSNPVIATVCHDSPPMPRHLALLQEGLEKLADWYKLPKKS